MSFKLLKGITTFYLFACLCSIALAQPAFKILHYTETSGFDHGTRQNSLAMFQALGAVNNFTVDDDSNGSLFDSLANLEQYAVVVFSNTSGDAILDSTQRANFEHYMNNGGSYVGIHAASDTYRHSTANGSNKGAWDWYAEMLGASVQQNPNHVQGTPQYDMHKIGTHPTTDSLPDPWTKNEEYYYWENGYYSSDNIPVLEVEETVGPNGLVNNYDSERPMSWYKILPGGGRSFYTALGHSNSNFTGDQEFMNHIRDAVLWAATDEPCTTQDIALNTGWNMISSYIIPDSPDVMDVISEVSDELLIIKNGLGEAAIPSLAINSIGNWNILEGYKVKMTAGSILSIGCVQIDPLTTPISLPAGWSLIAYLRTSPIEPEIALDPITPHVIIIKNADGNAFIPSLNINNLGMMLPGQGYQIKVSGATDLTYPGN